MKTFLLSVLLFIVFSSVAYAQIPVNDSLQNAIYLPLTSNFCSSDAQYTNVNATPTKLDLPLGWSSQGNDVWFSFTATHTDANITVTGASTGGGSTGGTLQSPLVALYTTNTTFNSDTDQVGKLLSGTGATSFYKGGLTIGTIYYIRVSAENNNTGTFRICLDNYSPPIAPGQDCGSASFLCTKESFTQTDVVGAGLNANESTGTCLAGSESNTAWYKWEAANNGTLTFVITPTVNTDDIDFVLYDLGTTNNCTISARNAIRCDAGHGIDCATGPVYYKTGLSTTATSTSEPGGCGLGQTGFVQYISMVQGHYYGLLINNFTSGNNGFTMSFDGTGTFVGPQAAFTVTDPAPCVPGRSLTFTSQASNYSSYLWTFGEGATPAQLTGTTVPSSVNVTYSTPGIKTAVLQISGGQGCVVVADTTFIFGNKPPKPTITPLKTSYCLLDTLVLTTPYQKDYTYQWTGPNNFSSTTNTNKLPLTSYNMAGTYYVIVTQYGCTSDTAAVILTKIGKKPVLSFTTSNNNLCTPQQSFNIVDHSYDYTSLQWDYGSGANTPTIVNDSTVTLTYSTYGTKTITLTATGDKGCVTVLTQSLLVPQKPAVPAIINNETKYCVGSYITLSTDSLANTTYSWTGPNNFSASTPTIHILATGNAVAGTYALVTTQGPCSSDPATIAIDTSQIIAIPLASFTASPVIPSEIFVPTPVQFTNTSTLADSYLWSFGDGNTSTDKNPLYTYQTKGDYTVTLTATSQGQCSNSISKGKLIVRFNVVIFIPNTFTPNGDDINDYFDVKITNTKSYHLQIFNRFGAKLYDAYNINDPWKGTFNGQAVPVGTYYYVIDTVTLNDDTLKESGSVTVIR